MNDLIYLDIAKTRARNREAARNGTRRPGSERRLLDQFGRVVEEHVVAAVGSLAAEVAQLKAHVTGQHTSEALIPVQRKYDIKEVRIRLYTGSDPLTLSDSERAEAEANALSVRTIERLVAAGDLERLVIGGSRLFSESQVQAYERRLAEGRASRPAARRGGKRRK